MQTRRLFVLPVILGVLLAACQTSSSNQPTEPVQATPAIGVTITVIPTATTIAPTTIPKGEAIKAVEPVEPTAIPMAIISGIFRAGFPLAIPRTRHTATLLNDGKILVAGGSVEGDDFALDEEIVDPQTGRSQWTAPLHTPRHDHTATLLPDGRVLVVGGYNLPQQWLYDAEVYDPQSDTWTVIPPISPHGTSHTATLMKNGKVLVVGGCIGSGVCTNMVDIFDPATNSWRPAASLLEERGGHIAQLLEDGRVLIAGGNTANNIIPADGTAILYDPTTNTWRGTGPMIVPRVLSESVKLHDGKVLVAGGILLGSDPPTTTNTAEIYDPATNSWQAVSPLSEARFAHVLAVHPDGHVTAISGSRDWDSLWRNDSFVSEIEVFDPATRQWQVVGELPEPGAFSTAVQLRDGRLWIVGGQEIDKVLDETWLVQP